MSKPQSMTARVRRALRLLSNRKIRDLSLDEGLMERHDVEQMLTTLEEALGEDRVDPTEDVPEHQSLIEHHKHLMDLIDTDEDVLRSRRRGFIDIDDDDYFVHERTRR